MSLLKVFKGIGAKWKLYKEEQEKEKDILNTSGKSGSSDASMIEHDFELSILIAYIDTIWTKYDTDRNGSISVDEAEGPLEGHFDQIDADGSGEITGAELKASRAKRFERGMEMRDRIKAADADGNGAISNNEANEAGLDKLIEHFDKIDSDGDGEITKQELKNLSNKHR